MLCDSYKPSGALASPKCEGTSNHSPLIYSMAFVAFIVDSADFLSKLLMDLLSAETHKTYMLEQDYAQHKHVRIPGMPS